MNSAISYLSAAQMHADAVRASYRNPPLMPKPERVVPQQRRRRPTFALRSPLFARI
jgi:hypothetical protein